MPTDAHGEAFTLYGVNGAAVAADVIARQCVVIKEFTYGERRCMNRPVNITHVFGDRLNPLYLDDPYSEPFYLDPQQVLQFEFANPSASGAGSFSFALEARKIQLEALNDRKTKDELAALRKRREKVFPFWVPLATSPVVSGVTLQVPGITIPAGGVAEALFMPTDDLQEILITRIMATALTAGVAGDTQEVFTVDIYDGKTYRLLNNQPITLNCMGGPATFPYILPTPWILHPNSVVRARFKNLITDATTDAFVTLQGCAVLK